MRTSGGINKKLPINFDDESSLVAGVVLFNQDPSDEMTARPDDTEKIENPLSVHDSLAGIEEDDNFVEVVNG